jgi:hypothetical protein
VEGAKSSGFSFFDENVNKNDHNRNVQDFVRDFVVLREVGRLFAQFPNSCLLY